MHGESSRVLGESRRFLENPGGFFGNSEDSWGMKRILGGSRGFRGSLGNPEDFWGILWSLGESWRSLGNLNDSSGLQRTLSSGGSKRLLGKSKGLLGYPEGSWGKQKVIHRILGGWRGFSGKPEDSRGIHSILGESMTLLGESRGRNFGHLKHSEDLVGYTPSKRIPKNSNLVYKIRKSINK